MQAQSQYVIHSYEDQTRNLSDMREIVQDNQGFIWISTANGLYRYDGYEFKAFRSHKGDGSGITSDEIKGLSKDNSGNLLCLIGNKAYIFDLKLYKYVNVLGEIEKSSHKTYSVNKICPLSNGTTWITCNGGEGFMYNNKQSYRTVKQMFSLTKNKLKSVTLDKYNKVWVKTDEGFYRYENGKLIPTSDDPDHGKHGNFLHKDRFGQQWTKDEIDAPGLKDSKSIYEDNQDNVWYIAERKLYRISFTAPKFSMLPWENDFCRYIFTDRLGRTWLTSRNNNRISIFGPDNKLLGYLHSDGTIGSGPEEFSSMVYAILQDRQGTIWMGTKPDGIYRLRPKADGSFNVDHFNKDSKIRLNDDEIIDIQEDKLGRIWFLGFRGGPNCIVNPQADVPQVRTFTNPKANDLKYRCLLITDNNALLASTNEGLVVADVSAKDLSGTVLKLHQCEESRESSLSSNALKGLVETHDGRIFICSENAGVNELVSKNLFTDQLEFRHYDTSNGFSADCCRMITEINGHLWITALYSLIEWNPSVQLPQGACVRLALDNGVDFSEDRPCKRHDGKWLFGLREGCAVIDLDHLSNNSYKPAIRLTSIPDADSITLASDERNLTLSFAALDYNVPEHLDYAVQMLGGDNDQWQFLGHTHDISYQNLEPGEYTLVIRSTNSDGEWVSNERKIHIVVTPTFWETGWAWLLYAFIVGVFAVIAYLVWRYIHNIKCQQQETLDAYMLLLNHSNEQSESHEEYRKELLGKVSTEAQDDAFIKKIVEYIDVHMSESDMNIDEMALFAAVSRSQLNHKLKQILGVTPTEMIREARMKHACFLLRDMNKTVNDVAYACGFSDPKYFSKCFKKNFGDTPSNYRLKSI